MCLEILIRKFFVSHGPCRMFDVTVLVLYFNNFDPVDYFTHMSWHGQDPPASSDRSKSG